MAHETSYSHRSPVRDLAPKSYSFDAYNELNFPNSRDRPFFEEDVVAIGDNYYLTKKFDEHGNLVLSFSSVCPKGTISFKDYVLSLEKYVTMLQGALAEKSDFITFEIETYVKQNHSYFCNRSNCESNNRDCAYIIRDNPKTITAAVSFNPTDIKNALSAHFGITQNIKGGNNTMKANMKKLFGMNFEFGMSHDTSIAATMLGVAVKNLKTGNWYIYDRATGTRKNYANMKFGDFRVLLVPDRVLNIGDLVKMDGKYYYVQAVSGSTATLLDAAEGIIVQKLLDECFIPGMNFYTKVVALDPRTMFDPSNQTDMSRNVLSAILMMQWSKGETEFSLDSINDDSFGGLGMLLLMGSGSDMARNLPLLLAMGGGNGDASDMLQMMILGQLMGGTTPAGATPADNPLGAIFGAIPGLAPAITPAPAATATGNVVCSSCGAEYPTGTNFCAKCGGKTQPKGKHCTQCGAVLMDGALFCQNCGKKVVIDACPHCDSKVTEGSNFCAKCGFKLSTPVTPTPVPAPVAPPTPVVPGTSADAAPAPAPEAPPAP